MGRVTLLPTGRDGWTVDDLEDLLEDGLRHELVDGSLHVSPPPTNRHDYVAVSPRRPPRQRAGRTVVCASRGTDRLRHSDYRQPDLMVIRRTALDSRVAAPADVLLAVEVMSPSSLTEDRLVKPAQCAAAGIPHYWRVEREVVPVLVTHELEGRMYREAERFTDEVVVERPVELHFRLDQLVR